MPRHAFPIAPNRISRHLAVVLWVAVVAGTYLALNRYIDEERLRHQKYWEQQLSYVAYAQSEQIGDWLAAKRQTVEMLAEDMSLRLYLTASGDDDSAQAQQTYLRHFILATARQAGFLAASRMGDIGADIDAVHTAGLAVIAPDGTPIVSTPSMPEIGSLWLMLSELAGTPGVTGPLRLKDGSLTVMVYAPVYPVQGDASTDEPIAYVLGMLAPQDSLFPYLRKGESPDSPAYSMLFEKDGSGVWNNLSTLWNTRPPLSFAVHDSDKAMPAEITAVRKPGQMIKGSDIMHFDSLVLGMPIAGSNWMLARRVSYDSAFAQLNERMMWLHAAYWLLVAAVTLLVIALWRHVTADKLARLLAKIRAHEALLTLVTDHIPARLFIADKAHRFRYANQAAASAAQMVAEEMTGKTLVAVMGNHAADAYVESNRRVLASKEPETRWHEETEETGDDVRYASEIQHIPLANIPSSQEEEEAGVLVIEHDLTDVIRARNASQRTLNKLIETLIMLVDMRDPHAARHSAGVAMIARAVASAMQLDAQQVRTVEIAGRLMNVGKLMVPVHILTSDKPLDDNDRALIQQAMQAGIRHLETIPFEGPVVDTIRQAQEHSDGSGPLGLVEADILPTAQVLAVANSFVAITSARSYRESKSVPQALDILQAECGKIYAKPVVIALAHYLDNLGGKAQWDAFCQA